MSSLRTWSQKEKRNIVETNGRVRMTPVAWMVVVSLWISCLEELCCGYVREQHPCVENYTLQYLRVMEA